MNEDPWAHVDGSALGVDVPVTEHEQGPPPLTDQGAIVAMLNENARLLNKLIDFQESTVPEGIPWKRPEATISSTTATLLDFDAFAYTIYNDGPEAVWYDTDGEDFPTDASSSRLRSRNTLRHNLGKRQRVQLSFRTAQNTAVLRVHGLL